MQVEFDSMKIPNQTNGHEPEFQVEGEIIESSHNHRGRISREKDIVAHKYFSLARKGKQWKIRATSLKSDAIEYEETGCDGTVIYELRQMNEEICRQEQGELTAGCLTAHGSIRHGNFPTGLNSGPFFPLWLAFCSSDYFVSRKDGRIVSPEFSEGDNRSRMVKPAQWQLNGSSLPSKVEWYLGGKDRGYPPPFDGVFLNNCFEVVSWNEFYGLQLPGRFELKIFFPNHLLATPDPTQGELCLLGVTEANVKSIQPLSGFSCLPELTRKTLVIDGRFRCSSSCDGLLSYGSSSWMTEEEVEAKNRQHGVKCEKQTAQA